jgi:hypothetical protein
MAAKKKPSPPGDAYYEAMLQDKIKAGLTLADATEVTARQRTEDLANGVVLDADTETDATPPEPA